jgi:hypothetical protein
MRRVVIGCFLVVTLTPPTGCCCVNTSKIYPVKGRVVSVKHEIIGSYMLARTYDLDDEQTPIPGARIYLAFDKMGEKPVPGYEARSDDNGLYEIDTKDIPPGEGGSNRYFVVVEKEGYETLTQETGLGFMAPYTKNTAVMKRLKQEQAPQH